MSEHTARHIICVSSIDIGWNTDHMVVEMGPFRINTLSIWIKKKEYKLIRSIGYLTDGLTEEMPQDCEKIAFNCVAFRQFSSGNQSQPDCANNGNTLNIKHSPRKKGFANLYWMLIKLPAVTRFMGRRHFSAPPVCRYIYIFLCRAEYW